MIKVSELKKRFDFLGREHDDESCNSINGRRAVKEQISFVFHGYCITHLDAFSHLSW